MPFQPGQSGNKRGRKPGVPNKMTRDLKDAILQAATTEGGKDGLVGYLRFLAREHPGPFCNLIGKVLPLTVDGNLGLTVTISRDDADL